ncbi:MAG: hypothetical protein A3E87_01755 [Gammaproteobacteria bacterium RIFCSPHIGHO2_12_FULL_35_23]|nr:MAG: hypothetical protein A3E87_01755 [Gammaproteobacteria bacterium RIFCSPHIGHO2_12_FULL_35_23]
MKNKKNHPYFKALQKAIDVIGSQSAVARAVGVTQQTVYLWDYVPAHHVLKVEAATNGAVTRHELRPDLYPPNE